VTLCLKGIIVITVGRLQVRGVLRSIFWGMTFGTVFFILLKDCFILKQLFTWPIIPVKFHIDYFDGTKWVTAYEQRGTFEYKKVSG